MEGKIQKILQACKHGMKKNAIDPAGSGSAVRSLEKGKKVTAKKIDQMYKNVLAYENDIASKSYFKLKLNPDADLTTQEKKAVLKDAVVNGVAKSKIEDRSHGVMDRLLAGKNVKDETVNRLYKKLFSIFGYDICDGEQKGTVQSAPERIRALELHVSSLLKEITNLKCEVKQLTENQQRLDRTKNSPAKPKTRKISGLTVTLKTDKVRGKSYKRWYAVTRHNGKRRMIYIGKDLSKAKDKISQGLERLKGNV